MTSIFSEERLLKNAHKVPVDWDFPHYYPQPVKHQAVRDLDAISESKVWDMARLAILQGGGHFARAGSLFH